MKKTMLITISLMLILVAGVFAQVSGSASTQNETEDNETDTNETETEETESSPVCPGGKWDSERGGCVSPSTPNRKWIEVSLSQEKVVAGSGETVELVVYLKNLHRYTPCEAEVCAMGMVAPVNYKLEFEGNQESLVGELSEDEVNLGPGAKAKVILTVKSKKKGANVFAVDVTGSDGSRGRVKGLLLVDGGQSLPPHQPETSFFVGNGFLLSDDESVGDLVEMKLFKEGNVLKGRVSIGTMDMRVEGAAEEVEESASGREYAIDLSFYKPEGDEVLATFTGTAIKYSTFRLLKGDFDSAYSGLEDGTLSVISRVNQVFRPVVFEEGEIEAHERTSVDEVIALKKRTKLKGR